MARSSWRRLSDGLSCHLHSKCMIIAMGGLCPLSHPSALHKAVVCLSSVLSTDPQPRIAGEGMGGTGFMVRPPTPFTRPYRVVVMARKVARPKDFIWQIVRHDPGQDVILKTSEQGFKTMEEAYSGGSIALIRYHKA